MLWGEQEHIPQLLPLPQAGVCFPVQCHSSANRKTQTIL